MALTREEHALRAEELLAEGEKVVVELREVAQARKGCAEGYEGFERCTRRMNELGKQAMGIWAQAQVHATLSARPQ